MIRPTHLQTELKPELQGKRLTRRDGGWYWTDGEAGFPASPSEVIDALLPYSVAWHDEHGLLARP